MLRAEKQNALEEIRTSYDLLLIYFFLSSFGDFAMGVWLRYLHSFLVENSNLLRDRGSDSKLGGQNL